MVGGEGKHNFWYNMFICQWKHRASISECKPGMPRTKVNANKHCSEHVQAIGVLKHRAPAGQALLQKSVITLAPGDCADLQL